jgi:LmbE family N-acetylglucosaminyl deacetylase
MNVLIVAAHTDDEALGCGGTITRHVAEGDTVNIIYMADGVTSREKCEETSFESRNAAAENAQAILGINKVYYLGLPDNRMDSLPFLDVVRPLEKIILQLKPEIVYTHHFGDLNVDHRITHQAVMTACRPLPDSCVREIYAFEVVSSTDWASPGLLPFDPNCYIDISLYLDVKMKALNAYALEMRPFPHARSTKAIEALACLRGSQVGLEAAEAFIILRQIK